MNVSSMRQPTPQRSKACFPCRGRTERRNASTPHSFIGGVDRSVSTSYVAYISSCRFLSKFSQRALPDGNMSPPCVTPVCRYPKCRGRKFKNWNTFRKHRRKKSHYACLLPDCSARYSTLQGLSSHKKDSQHFWQQPPLDGVASASPDGMASASPDGMASASPDGMASASPDGMASASPDGMASASPDGMASASCSENFTQPSVVPPPQIPPSALLY
jgi:hypothetical protein